MKIAIICDVLGKGNNGTAVVTQNLYEHLKEGGHNVTIICADQSKKDAEGYFVLPTVKLGKVVDAYVDSVGVCLAKCDKKVMDRVLCGVDYIHCIMPFALGRYAAGYARRHNIPISAGFHLQAENITSYLKLNRLSFLQKLVYKFLYRSFYSKMDAIHYPTQFIKDTFENAIGKTTNGYVISNGVNGFVTRRTVEKPREYADKIVIGNVGRYSREKSQDTLIKAVKYSKYADRIQLILAGQGNKEKYYKRLAKNLPVMPKFGALSREGVVDMLNYCDIYAHTAEIELEGIACLEAIKCGKLTIVSDSKLSATAGFAADERCIFKNRNPKSLAKTIDFWIENADERRVLEQAYLNSGTAEYTKECM
ncbi:MAG: glycosyltransferase, partial [Clostridia bacterium]|nr:glycosyltransferase [Clostridia bacterium]